MGFRDFFRIKKREAKVLSVAGAVGADFRPGYTSVSTPGEAMQISAAFRAVAILSDSVGKLPFEYKVMAGKRYVANNVDKRSARIYNLLTVSPNRRMTAFEFFKNLVKQMLFYGNAYIVPIEGKYGDIIEFVLCSPGSVSYDLYSDRYTIMDLVNGINEVRYGKDMIHVRNESLDGGYTGVSTLTYARHQLDISATADKETLNRFATGGRFKALVANNNSVKGFGQYQSEALQDGADILQEQISAGKDIIRVPGDATVSPMSMTSADMQFLDSRKFTVKDIARFFNVPPILLMDETNMNYKSGDMASVLFLSHGLSPLLTKIEQEFRQKLIPVSQWADFKFEFDVERLFTTDLTTRGAWMQAQLNTGVATVNELRAMNDRSPVEGGDVALVSTNLAPLGSEKLMGKSDTTEGGQPKTVNSTEE